MNKTGCTRDGGGSGVCCDDICVDTGNDSANCDGCGNVCPVGASCHGSTCQLAGQVRALCADGGDGGCGPGLSCAGGYFCGTLACPAGEVGGLCALATGAADRGTCCSGACADLTLDDLNCGVCGFVCVDGGYCRNGGCSPNPDCNTALAGAACRLTESSVGGCCGGGCLDLEDDSADCGLCGQECPSDGSCLKGDCLLPDGGSASCVDAGALCPAGSACVGAACLSLTCGGAGARCGVDQPEGAIEGQCCDGGCVDSAHDAQNCGGCGKVCPSGICDGGCVLIPDAGDAGDSDGGADGG